jgi:hypothetical protein
MRQLCVCVNQHSCKIRGQRVGTRALTKCPRNSDKAERVVQLEWENEDVHPSQLGYAYRVREGKGRVEDTVRRRQYVVHCHDRIHW